eukprot:g2941.t1
MPPTSERDEQILLNRRHEQYANMEKEASSKEEQFAEGRLSLSTKLAYAAPTMSTLPIVLLFAVYITVFYEKMGAPLSYISLFIALARSLDVITDPLMSHVTDSKRGPSGRRRPFILTGCVPYGVLLYLVCSPPPEMEDVPLSIYFGSTYILFYLMNTYCNIPYDALGPELTDNYEDRSRLFFVSGLFDGIGALIAITSPQVASFVFEAIWPHNKSSCNVPEALGGELYRIGSHGCTTNHINPAEYIEVNISSQDYAISKLASLEADICSNSSRASTDSFSKAYCLCHARCTTAYVMGSEVIAMRWVGFGFGFWYIVTALICVYSIKERSQSGDLQISPPLVVSSLNTFHNLPFVFLLPAWAADAVTNGIISAMVTYFVRYVVQAEYGPGCNGGLNTDDWKCSSLKVVGISITMTLLAAFMFTPMWLFLAKRFGKRNTWLAWSISMAATNIMYIFVTPQAVYLCIIVSFINGIPFGAKFLADAILADIIDYDEFLTGQRSEATYTMFKSFLPKICAIPAAAIPLALLSAFGHVEPVNGMIQRQPESVTIYVRVITVIIPTLISLTAFFLKLKFPFKTKEQCDNISSGVASHLMNYAATDPLTGIKYRLTHFTDAELDCVYTLDHFTGIKVIEKLIEDTPGTSKKILEKMNRDTLCWAVCIVVALSLSIASIAMGILENKIISFIPVLLIVLFGCSLTSFLFHKLKRDAALKLVDKTPPKKLLQKVLQQRINISTINTAIKAGGGIAKQDASVIPMDDGTESADVTESKVKNTAGEDDSLRSWGKKPVEIAMGEIDQGNISDDDDDGNEGVKSEEAGATNGDPKDFSFDDNDDGSSELRKVEPSV